MRWIHSRKVLLLAVAAPVLLVGQEAKFGFADPITLSFISTQTGRPASPGRTAAPAFRANLYPTLKLGGHWFAYGAVQVHTAPYFYEELSSATDPAGALHVSLLQAYAGYTRVRDGRSFTFKAGHLTSAFGSFPLRYDDARNWLIDLPQAYGYYYVPVSVYGMHGAEIDVTLGRVDARAQFTTSSPANPRVWRNRDQYPNWTGGAGVTIRQGFRVGASVMHGPYLHRQHRFFFRGEAAPRRLPATGYGVDVQWARGRWNVNGELQRFQYPYRAIPYFFQTLGYGEARWAFHPRWYIAGRSGFRQRTAGIGRDQAHEAVLAFRPAAGHLLKFGYLMVSGPFAQPRRDNVFGLQYVVSLNPPAISLDGGGK